MVPRALWGFGVGGSGHGVRGNGPDRGRARRSRQNTLLRRDIGDHGDAVLGAAGMIGAQACAACRIGSSGHIGFSVLLHRGHDVSIRISRDVWD